MKRTPIALALPVVAFTFAIAQGRVQDCSAPESSKGLDPRYDALVCEGLKAMEAGQYEAAIRNFEEAMSIRLPEVPNFMLFSRLALVHWKAGHVNRAREELAKAELALKVLVGILECKETDTGFAIVNRYGEPISSPEAEAVKRRMCGAAYEYYYERQSLEEFVSDARLVEVFLAVRKMIGGMR
jgi:tetratricopeptide (TPR) repeat protein